MSRDNLGIKQTIILHSCITNDERYDLVITPHRQTVGYIRTKRQTLRKKIISKQKQIIRKRFSKQIAVSESETSEIQIVYKLKDSTNKNHQITINHIFLTQKQHHSHQSKENEVLKSHIQTNRYAYTIGINQ